jgi:hypothetical protein
MSPDVGIGARVETGSQVTSAVTHGTSVEQEWIDLLVADDEWVRREFDELVASAWGGSRPPGPRTRQGAHEPRRSGPRSRPTPKQESSHVAQVAAHWRRPSRAPPGLNTGPGSISPAHVRERGEA